MPLDMESDDLTQTAILWAYSGLNSFGVITITDDEPVEVKIRTPFVIRDNAGAQESPKDKPIEVVVDQDITVGSIMWIGGGFVDLSGTSTVPTGDFRIVTNFSETPDLKGRSFYRTVTLAYFGNTLPERS